MIHENLDTSVFIGKATMVMKHLISINKGSPKPSPDMPVYRPHPMTTFSISDKHIVTSKYDIDPELVKNISAQIDAEIVRALRYGFDFKFTNEDEENYSRKPGDPYSVGMLKPPVT